MISADNVMPDNKEVLSVDNVTSDARNNVVGISGSKRKQRDNRLLQLIKLIFFSSHQVICFKCCWIPKMLCS